MTLGLHHLLALAAALPLAAAAISDVATRTLPDRAALAVAAIGLAARVPEGAASLLWSLAAAAAVFGGCFLLWLRGWLGGGDAKLLPAAALLVPAAGVPALLLAVALAGGILAIAYLALPHLLPDALPALPGRGGALGARLRAVEARRLRRGAPLPYGVAIAAGALAATLLVSGR